MSVKIDGKAAALTKQDPSTWVATIIDLPAKKLHELHTIELGGATAEYGALSWANNKLGKTGTAQEKKDDQISRALYLYNKYARLYFNYDTAGLK